MSIDSCPSSFLPPSSCHIPAYFFDLFTCWAILKVTPTHSHPVNFLENAKHCQLSQWPDNNSDSTNFGPLDDEDDDEVKMELDNDDDEGFDSAHNSSDNELSQSSKAKVCLLLSL